MKQKKILLKKRKLYLIVNVTPKEKFNYSRVEDILTAGVDILQLRCKDISDKCFLYYAFKARELTIRHKTLLIINDRPDIAKIVDSDGLHLGQDDISPQYARKLLGREAIIGLSTHNSDQINNAIRIKELDYIGIGPIFRTKTKPSLKPIGIKILNKFYQQDISFEKLRVNTYLIGGIDLKNLTRVLKPGVTGIALSSAVLKSKEPRSYIKKLRSILNDTDRNSA